jgi:hypothetical protein
LGLDSADLAFNQPTERLVCFLLLNLGEFLGPLEGSVLNADTDSQRAKSEQKGSEVHAKGQRSGHEEEADRRVADHDVLDIKFGQQDDEEPPVVVDGLKHIQLRFVLTANLAAIEHVEQVHQHESLEQQSKMLQAHS